MVDTLVDNTARFDGLADLYDGYRPGYPRELFARLAQRLGAVDTPRHALDVGCGTGIATRALADALGSGWRVTGVEPGADMYRKAREVTTTPAVDFVQASAEALPMADGSVALVLTAQALHWFDRPRFYAEAARVLVSGGHLAVVFNNRKNKGEGLLAALEDFAGKEWGIERRFSRDWDIAAEHAALADFSDAQLLSEDWTERLTPAGLVGYFMSRSTVKPALERVSKEELGERLLEAAVPLAQDGWITLPYTTELHLATRR